MIARLPLLSRILVHQGNVSAVATDMGITRGGVYTAGPVVRRAISNVHNPHGIKTAIDLIARDLAKADRDAMAICADYTELYRAWLTDSLTIEGTKR